MARRASSRLALPDSSWLDQRTSPFLDRTLKPEMVGSDTQRYFYDPDRNLDCVTVSAGTAADCLASGGSVSPRLLADWRYDYLNRPTAYRSFATDGTTSVADDSADYVYDALDRTVSQTEGHGTDAARTTELSYLGLTNLVSGEDHCAGSAPADSQLLTTKSYSYDAFGHRIGLTDDPPTWATPTPATGRRRGSATPTTSTARYRCCSTRRVRAGLVRLHPPTVARRRADLRRLRPVRPRGESRDVPRGR